MTSHGAAPSIQAETKPNTLPNFGFWIYLMSDVILFSMLFATFLVLGSNYAGGPTGSEMFKISDTFMETMALLVSSLTYGLAMLGLHVEDRSRVIRWLGVTFLLGLVFIGLEVREFLEISHEGGPPWRSGYWSAFYTLVGTHGTHVTFGLIWIATMIGQVTFRGLTPQVASRLTRLSMFWHFLDVVWIAVFSTVYLPSLI